MSAVNGALLVVVFAHIVPLWQICLWYGAAVIVPVIQIHSSLKLRRRAAPRHVSGRMLEVSKLWVIYSGSVWGMTAVIFFPDGSVSHHLYLAVVLAGSTAAMQSVMGSLPFLCTRFIITCLAPLIIRLTVTGNSLEITVAVMSTFFGIALIKGSQISFKQFASIISVSHQLERARAHLVNAIESTNDAFAIFNEDGKLAIANRRFLDWFPGMTSVSLADSSATLYRSVAGRWVQSSLRPIPGGGYVSVHTDVTALKEREDELVQANAAAEAARLQAEEASRAKSEFLANMSHELRTPLNAIMGFSELMQTEIFGPIGSPRYKEYLGDVHRSATHLLSIISDILDLSKIESSNYKIERERVDIGEIVGWVVTLATQKRMDMDARSIEVEIADDARWLMLDMRATKQVLLNLVGNALKFTPGEGRVGVRVMGDAEGATRIVVWDTGIGIPKDKLEWVKQPFSQFESVFQRKFHGTGLGLSISDALVKLQGGRLSIESELGKGTQVMVLFPPEARAAAPDELATAQPKSA